MTKRIYNWSTRVLKLNSLSDYLCGGPMPAGEADILGRIGLSRQRRTIGSRR